MLHKVLALTGLTIGCSVTVSLTGLPIQDDNNYKTNSQGTGGMGGIDDGGGPETTEGESSCCLVSFCISSFLNGSVVSTTGGVSLVVAGGASTLSS